MNVPNPRPIRFVHRDTVVEVTDAPTTQSVLYWLRERAHRVGTKEGCNEGDCGACMVLVGERDEAAPGGVALRAVNACLPFVSSLDGKALWTVEDLKTIAGGALHPVQRAMVDHHGSQCGFCTPGFTMTLAACYEHHRAAGTRPDRQALADDLSGNLCRCTGYRPILDAGVAMFDAPIAVIDRLRVARLLDTLADDPPLVHRAKGHAADDGVAEVLAPRTVEQLADWYADRPDARLVAGATDVGLWVTKQFRPMPSMIRVDRVDDLRAVSTDSDGTLIIGAAASLEAAWDALVARHPSLREMQLRFASRPLRRVGTLGGNVANGSPIGDGPPVLLALDAVLVLRHRATRRRAPLAAFYTGYMKNALAPGEFVESIEVPPSPDRAVRAYKVSKRYDCDISTVAAGLAIRLDGDRVVDARFAFGGLAATARRALDAEAAVRDRRWTEDTLSTAIAALDFEPLDDLRGSAAFRQRIAANLLRRFWLETRVDTPLAASQLSVRAA